MSTFGPTTFTINMTPPPKYENGYYWWKRPDNQEWEPVTIVNDRVGYIGQTVTQPVADVQGEFVHIKTPGPQLSD